MKNKAVNFIQTLLVTSALAGSMTLPEEAYAADKSSTTISSSQEKNELFNENGYRANQEIQKSLDKIWDIEGDAHRKINMPSIQRVHSVNVKLPSLISEIESAMTKETTNFSKELSSELSDSQLSQTRRYLRELSKDNLQDVGLKKAGRTISNKTLETAGQVETGSKINPLTPPKSREFHSIPKRMDEPEKKAKVEYNLRNYKSPDGKLNQGNNNFFIDLGRRESNLNPWAGKPKNDRNGCKLMFQMCSKERSSFGGSRAGDWQGQRAAAESLAAANTKFLEANVPNLEHKVINFPDGRKFRPDESSLAGASWITGAPNTSNFLNGKVQTKKNGSKSTFKFSTDSLGTNPLEYMLEFSGHNVSFNGRTQQTAKNARSSNGIDSSGQHSFETRHETGPEPESETAKAIARALNKTMKGLESIRNTIRPLIMDDNKEESKLKTEDKKTSPDLSFNSNKPSGNILDRIAETERQNNPAAIVSNEVPQKDQQNLDSDKTKWQDKFAASEQNKSYVEKIAKPTSESERIIG